MKNLYFPHPKNRTFLLSNLEFQFLVSNYETPNEALFYSNLYTIDSIHASSVIKTLILSVRRFGIILQYKK